MAVISKFAGVSRVDTQQEQREFFSGELRIYFAHGELVKVDKIPNSAPVVVNAKKEKAVK